jgi:chromosome segregation ATPase
MIVVPTSIANATDLIAKLQARLDDYRAQIDNLTAVQQTTARALAVQAEELKVTVGELEQTRDDLECAQLTIAQLDEELDSVRVTIGQQESALDSVRADRDTYRAQASVTS